MSRTRTGPIKTWRTVFKNALDAPGGGGPDAEYQATLITYVWWVIAGAPDNE
jgi:hypothetical protein